MLGLKGGRADTFTMPRRPKHGIASNLLESAVRAGFHKAYTHVQVDPARFLRHMQRSHRLPIRSWQEMQYFEPELIQPHARRIISSSTKVAALEGMGFGMGGLLTILPDMGILSAITIRMLQKLSLIHGFEYNTEEEVTALWVAAASAAGLDLGREFLGKQAMDRVVPRIIDRIAAKMGAEVAEKWSGRLIPLLSAGVGGALNYYFVRAWGRRAHRHFFDRHRAIRSGVFTPAETPALVLDPHGRLLPS
jgi:EcsC protein family